MVISRAAGQPNEPTMIRRGPRTGENSCVRRVPTTEIIGRRLNSYSPPLIEECLVSGSIGRSRFIFFFVIARIIIVFGVIFSFFFFFATFNFLLCCPLNKFDSNLKFEYLLLSETYSLYFLKLARRVITIKHGLKIIIYVLLLFLRNFNFHNR